MTFNSVSNVVDATNPATSDPPLGHGDSRLPGQYGPN